MSSCVLSTVIDDHKDSCCGSHTVLRHGHHQGYLVGDGRLFCDTGSGQLQKCSLQWTPASKPCVVIVDTKGHKHGPDCGHEAVPHDDHFDFLVEDELQHVVTGDSCCPKKCVSVRNQNVVSHGIVEIIRKGKALFNSVTTPNPQYELLEIVTARPEIVTTSRIVAEGICCPSEVPVIERTLNPLPGVYKVEVSVVTKTVIVEHDSAQVSPGVLVGALNGANLSASLASNYKLNEDLQQTQSWKSWIPPIHILICFLLLMLSLISYAGGNLENFKYVALGSIVVGIWPILLKACGALRACFLDIHILMTLAVVGAVAIGEYAEGAAVVLLFGLADWLEGKCTKHASNALAAVLSLQPDTAFVKDKGEEVEADQVAIGEIVVVKPGCKVPTDGVVNRGQTFIDESMLTGESQPVYKDVGDKVMSGTLNTGSQAIDVCTTNLAADSTASRIGKLIEEASRKKAPTERIVNNIAKYYTPMLLLATVLVIVIPLILKVDNSKEWIIKGLVLLVSACPCALVLSTPVTVVCGLARAAQKGVVIKGAQYLEALGRCQFMSFDKTGTLTRGQVELVHVGKIDTTKTEQEIVQLAASLESHSSHPLANAVMGYAAAKGYNNWSSATVCESIPGEGIRGEINCYKAFVGNQNMVKIVCPAVNLNTLEFLQSREKNGETIVFVGLEGELWGYLALKDQARDEAKQAVDEIKKYGVQVGMMTGDRKLVAHHIADELGIEQQYVGAQLLPQQKLILVETVKKTNKLCHVGDGVNDGPALAAADVGVAMGVAGSAVAIETADIALFTSDLRQLAFALQLSRSAVKTILVNVFFSITIKMVVIVLAFTIGVNLWLAVLADVGSCITVILHSMTILYINSSSDTYSKKGCVGKSCELTAQKQLDYQDSCCEHDHSHGHHGHSDEKILILGGIQKSDEAVGNLHVHKGSCNHSNHGHKCCSGDKNKHVVVEKKGCSKKTCGDDLGWSTKSTKKTCGGSKKCEISVQKGGCSKESRKSSCCSQEVKKACCGSQSIQTVEKQFPFFAFDEKKQLECSTKDSKSSCCTKESLCSELETQNNTEKKQNSCCSQKGHCDSQKDVQETGCCKTSCSDENKLENLDGHTHFDDNKMEKGMRCQSQGKKSCCGGSQKSDSCGGHEHGHGHPHRDHDHNHSHHHTHSEESKDSKGHNQPAQIKDSDGCKKSCCGSSKSSE